ncbi:hypothetical protein D3C84_832780 [compost metagenome]
MFSASVGEQTIGSPRRFSEVFSDTPLPVSFSSSSIRSYQRGLWRRSSTWAREVPSSWTTSGTRLFHSSLTSKVKVMNGLGWSTLSICGATVSSIDGQNGLQRSRNLICSLMRSATPAALGQPMIERPPRARGPNSMRPWNQATGLPSTMILAMRSAVLSMRCHLGAFG